MPRVAPRPRPATASIPAWEVIDQEQDSSYLPDGASQPDWIVHYQTETGVVASVRIPAALYTEEHVAGVIHEAAGHVNRVSKLTSATTTGAS